MSQEKPAAPSGGAQCGHTHHRGRGGHDHAGHGHGGHDHSGHDHSHVPEITNRNERLVLFVMILTGGFMVVEAIGGVLSGSLALLADAGHMLTDTVALALAWVAFRLARKPADAQRSYGYHRFQILAAFTNGLALFVIAGWIVLEAVRRIVAPVEVMGWPMMVIAALGLLVNIAGFWLLTRGDAQENLNMRGAALHVLGDLLGSVAAIVAAGVILMTGWTPIDPILSVFVAVIILRSAWRVVKASAHILLEGAPEGLDADRIAAALREIDGVVDVHHVHAWSLTNERTLLTLHAVLSAEADMDGTLGLINKCLQDVFGIGHATIQVERAGGVCHHPDQGACGAPS